MSVRELGRRLNLSPSLISRLIRRGMPAYSEEAAREWRARCIRPRVNPARVVPPEAARRGQLPGDQEARAAESGTVTELGAEQLEDTIPRLRGLEKSLALAAERAFRNDKIAEAISLRREHVAAIRALYDAELKLIRINEARGRLITVDRALAMISESMAEPIILLRRLPELGRDPEEKQRLETFLTAVLNALRDGAEASLRRSALPRQAAGG